MIVSPGQDNWNRIHPKPKPAPVPVPTPVVATGVPAPPAGWVKTYTHDFAHTAGLADWVLMPGDNAPVAVHTTPGSEFGLGIECTAVSQWSELISADAVIGPSSFIEALLFIPLASNGEVANWPAFWTTGQNWPEDGEIDILEGQSGAAALQTHYGTLTSTGGASENSPSADAPRGTGNWLTVTLLRQSNLATATYTPQATGKRITLGPVAAPFAADHKLIWQNQSYSTSVCPNCFGPTVVPSTAYLSNVEIYAPKELQPHFHAPWSRAW